MPRPEVTLGYVESDNTVQIKVKPHLALQPIMFSVSAEMILEMAAAIIMRRAAVRRGKGQAGKSGLFVPPIAQRGD